VKRRRRSWSFVAIVTVARDRDWSYTRHVICVNIQILTGVEVNTENYAPKLCNVARVPKGNIAQLSFILLVCNHCSTWGRVF